MHEMRERDREYIRSERERQIQAKENDKYRECIRPEKKSEITSQPL